MNNSYDSVGRYIDLLKKVLTASIYDESGWAVKDPNNKNAVLNQLKKKNLYLVEAKVFNEAERAEGRDWPLFGYTMAGHQRLDNVQLCVEQVIKNNIPGDFVETGSWRGGMTIFMRALLDVYGVSDRFVWVADSFEGLPVPADENDGLDLSQVDYLKVSLEQVKANFEKFNLLDDQVKFLKGWFADTLPTAPIKDIAILRLDGDLYSSTMDSLENLYPKVSKGGFVIVDDYNSWPACKRAVTEYLAAHSIIPDIQKIDWTAVYWQV